MAEVEFTPVGAVKTKRTGPPRDLSRRFPSTAQPAFIMLATAGDVELWKTEAGGVTRFHVVEQRSAASANIQCHDKAWQEFRRLVEREPLPGLHFHGTEQERQRALNRRRHAMQAPIAAPRYRVMYMREGKERRSAWLYREDHARRGLEMMRAKYGQRNAIIYVD